MKVTQLLLILALKKTAYCNTKRQRPEHFSGSKW